MKLLALCNLRCQGGLLPRTVPAHLFEQKLHVRLPLRRAPDVVAAASAEGAARLPLLLQAPQFRVKALADRTDALHFLRHLAERLPLLVDAALELALQRVALGVRVLGPMLIICSPRLRVRRLRITRCGARACQRVSAAEDAHILVARSGAHAVGLPERKWWRPWHGGRGGPTRRRLQRGHLHRTATKLWRRHRGRQRLPAAVRMELLRPLLRIRHGQSLQPCFGPAVKVGSFLHVPERPRQLPLLRLLWLPLWL
mmetsp:Transcript_32448/g.89763  ORF Transcript_32448/g.89763 Transcript_32448/m.89763 type:complete len:255 (-) Transcript_32448:119-883(-)